MKEFKVNVAPLIKKLELVSKKGISGELSGEFTSIVKGAGLEFRGFRVYTPGVDDAKNIDWKASLRSKNLVVREMVEERNNNVMFLIDVSSTMSFGSVDLLKNEYVIEMFSNLAYSLITGGDSVGLAIFSDKIIHHIRPNIGNQQYYTLLKTMTTPEYYEGVKKFQPVLHDFNAALERRAIIMIISDFLGMDDNWRDELKVMAVQHEVIAFVVRDPRDQTLPAEVGQVFVSDPNTGEDLLIDTRIIKEDYENYMKTYDTDLKEYFKHNNIDNLFITTDKYFKKELMSFFTRRSRGG
ncbi:MAG: DUF58 domain-containing protein [Candidatus Woesearchaeota archaeon]